MTLSAELAEYVQLAGNRDKLLLTLITGSSTITNLAGLTTTQKGSLVAALNEIRELALDSGSSQPVEGGGAWSDQYPFKGDWSSATATGPMYNQNDLVYHNGALWYNTGGGGAAQESAPSDNNSTAWTRFITIGGEQAWSSEFPFKGTWVEGQVYEVNDVVRSLFANRLYILTDTTLAEAQSWMEDPLNSASWSFFDEIFVPELDDSAPAFNKVYSSDRVEALLAQVRDDILGGAGPAFDSLLELKELMDASDAGDESAIEAITTALGSRVRFDAAQSLTTGQQAQARSNIGAASAADVGSTSPGLVAIYQAALL